MTSLFFYLLIVMNNYENFDWKGDWRIHESGGELAITHKEGKCDVVICCFGGLALQMGMVPPFEFLNYLSKNYTDCDLRFFVDKKGKWYHEGIEGISGNVEETVDYLRAVVDGYKKVIFMGVSAGGYASILFGSLCKVNVVIAFIPQTVLEKCVDEKYKDLKDFVCEDVQYILYGDMNCKNGLHDVSHVERMEEFENVVTIKQNGFGMKGMRDSGKLKELLDGVILAQM